MALNVTKLLRHFLEPGAKSALTIDAYGKDLDDLRQHLKEATVDAAVQRLLGGTHPAGQAILANYKAAMQGRRGLGSATVNRRLSTLRSLGKEARILGMVPWVLEARNVRHEFVRDTRGPGIDNIVKLLTYIEEQPPTAPLLRDTAIIRLITDLALRRGTVCKVNVSDFAAGRRELKVTDKGKKSKSVKGLTVAAARAIERWLKVRGPAPGAMFINFDRIHHTKTGKRLTGSAIYEIVKARAAEAGVKGPIRPHGVRHTSISIAAEAGAKKGLGLNRIKEFSGHANTRTLELYLDKTHDIQADLAESVSIKISARRRGRRNTNRRSREG